MATETLTPHTTGRPTKCTPDLIAKISRYIRQGNYASVACQATGISERVYYDWLSYAERDDAAGVESIYLQFFHAIKNAEAAHETELASKISEHALKKDDWLAGITFLERRYRERWGRPAPVTVIDQSQKQINITRVEVHEIGSGVERSPEIIEVKQLEAANVQRQREAEGSQ